MKSLFVAIACLVGLSTPMLSELAYAQSGDAYMSSRPSTSAPPPHACKRLSFAIRVDSTRGDMWMGSAVTYRRAHGNWHQVNSVSIGDHTNRWSIKSHLAFVCSQSTYKVVLRVRAYYQAFNGASGGYIETTTVGRDAATYHYHRK